MDPNRRVVVTPSPSKTLLQILIASIAAAATMVWASSSRADDHIEPASRLVPQGKPEFTRLSTTYSAFSLEKGEINIGLQSSGVAVLASLEVGTQLLLDLSGFYNAFAKWSLYEDRHQAVAVRLATAYFNHAIAPIDVLEPGDDFELTTLAFPVGVGYSRAFSRFAAHVDVLYVHFATFELVDIDDAVVTTESEIAIPGFGTGLSGRLAAEYNFKNRDVVYLEAVIPIITSKFTRQRAGEEFTREYDAKLALPTVTLSYIWRWPIFRFRIGAGVGPVVVVSEDADAVQEIESRLGFVPAIDIFWRF